MDQSEDISLKKLSIIFLTSLALLSGIFFLTSNPENRLSQLPDPQKFLTLLTNSEKVKVKSIIADFNDRENKDVYCKTPSICERLTYSQSSESYKDDGSIELKYQTDGTKDCSDGFGLFNIHLINELSDYSYINVWTKAKNENVVLNIQLITKDNVMWEAPSLRGLTLIKDEWSLIKIPLKEFKSDKKKSLKSEDITTISFIFCKRNMNETSDNLIYIDKVYLSK